MRLLIIEDESAIVQALKNYFRRRYIIETAATGRSGLHLACVCNYDLIILDLGLPDLKGTEVCRAIRANGIKTPILILTGTDEVKSKVACLDSGADDYLTKPFDFAELTARIRAILRRNPVLSNTTLCVYDLVLDPSRRLVVRGNQILALRRKEFDLLEYLMRNKGKVLKREMILENVWQGDKDAFTNTVDVHIKYLRDHIGEHFSQPLIKTIYGIGYMFDA